MATLYELSGQYSELMSRLEAAETPDDAEAVLNELDQVTDNLASKAEAYAKMLRNKQAEAEAYKAEKERLAKKQQAAENMATWLKENIQNAMTLLGKKRIDTSIGSWRIVRNPASVVITDESKVPADFRIPQPDKIDKRGILAAYRDTGEIPDGTDILESEGVRFR